MYNIIILFGNSSGGVPETQYAHKPWKHSHPHSNVRWRITLDLEISPW